MKIHLTISILCLALLTTTVYADNKLERITLTAPIPASQYANQYVENDVNQISDYVMFHDKKRSYQFYASSTSDKPQALVILLHGDKRTGKSVLHEWRHLADQENLILIAPDAIDGSWNSQDRIGLFDAIIKEVKYGYNIDNKRIYIFGHSRGAILALSLGITHPQRFAAIGIHAGGLKQYPLMSRFTGKRRTPMVLINGTHDNAVPLDFAARTADMLTKHNHTTRLVTLDGHNHWYYDIADFINQEAWKFMKQYKLD